MKLLYKHENMMIIHSLKNILEMNDIDCLLKNEHGHPMGAEFGLSNTYLELWIHDDNDFDAATTILNQQLSNPDPTECWVCENCHEQNAANFGACWNCQQTLKNVIA